MYKLIQWFCVFVYFYALKNKGSSLAFMVPWRTLNIHGTNNGQMFFRLLKWKKKKIF